MGREQRTQQGDLERFKAIAGEIRRAHIFDSGGCPRCGGPARFKKKYCYGLEPDLGRVLVGFEDCRLVGPHLHSECEVCGFHWFERTNDDDMMRDGRGALRFDEVVSEDGEIVRTKGGLRVLPPEPQTKEE